MDKLLDVVKDFPAIKKFLVAINQTTDDFLFVFYIPQNRIQFFGSIRRFFEVGQAEDGTMSLDAFLDIVHPADHKTIRKDLDQIRLGFKNSHDIDFRMFNRDGKMVWVNSRGKVLHDESGAPYVLLGRLSEEVLRHLYHPVTGLWNKTKLREDLKKRLPLSEGWLMMLSIPTLSEINLSHGVSFGNQLLCEIANTLERIGSVKESYHTDQNEFAVILRECESDVVEQTYGRIRRDVDEKCAIFASAVPIDNDIFTNVSQMMDSANITLRTALSGNNRQVKFFSAQEIGQRLSDLALLESLKESVHNDFDGFEVYYQPQIKSGTYDLYGVEALLRYTSQKRGRVFPDEFIPILEQSGLIADVGMWVLNQALERCKRWRSHIPSLQMSVNISSVQFEDRYLGQKIGDALCAAQLPGSALTLELTESVELNRNEAFQDTIKYLKSRGVRFSIDDFGTGYSNLGYLKQLEVNEIKIDRSFVSEIEKNTYNYRLISNVIDFARSNAIHACCEGVETARELSILEPLKADFFQGYLFDKPCTAEDIDQKYIYTDSEKYTARMQAIEEIRRFKEQYGSICFSPANILDENSVGLWIICLDEKNGHVEMYMDNIMERELGVAETLSPTACYQYWFDHIAAEDVERVKKAIDLMISSENPVCVEYRWQHPTLGEITMRNSGIRTRNENGKRKLEGYHCILTGTEEA